MQIAKPRDIITSEAALKAVQAAVAQGAAIGKAVVAAVTDPSGDLLALLRADGAFTASVGIARDKAYTAAVFGLPSDVLGKALDANPILREGIALRPNVVLFGGGLPIVTGGAPIGAIGVSGGSEEDDRLCAAAGISALGL
jgi:uncharacterized protein GlcG (DUF336 family)